MFPLRAGTKEPATQHGVKDATLDPTLIQKWWSENPEYNIGLACGEPSGVWVVDVDVDSSKNVNGFVSLNEFPDLPSTIMQTTPRGGKHYLFQSGTPVKNKNGFRHGIDIRGTGYYIVLAPSVLEGGLGYEWDTGHGPGDKPLAMYPKYLKPVTAERPTRRGIYVKQNASDEATIRRASAWAAAVEPAIEGNAGHSRLLSAANGLVHGFQLSDSEAYNILVEQFNPRCTPPWNLMNPRDHADFRRKIDEARSNPPNKPRGWLLNADRTREVDPAIDAVCDKLMAGVPIINPAVADTATEIRAPEPTPKPKPAWPKGARLKVLKINPTEQLRINLKKEQASRLRTITAPPGYFGKITEWIDDSCKRYGPIMSVAATLAFLGAVYGRKITDKYGTRTNVYTMSIARTGGGKQHAMSCLRYLAEQIGASDIMGALQVSSDIAILKRLSRNPVVCYLWDEIGHFLSKVKESGKSTHIGSIVPMLMTLYSAADGTLSPKEYSDSERNLQELVEPCVCVYGVSTPERFSKGLDREQFSDGWLGRCLVFQQHDFPRLKSSWPNYKETLDEGIVEVLSEWMVRNAGEEEPSFKNGVVVPAKPKLLVLDSTPEADAIFREYENKFAILTEVFDDTSCLWVRAIENARKVALIVAASSDFYNPVITGEHARYGCVLVEYIITDFISEVVPCVAESRFELLLKKAKKTITEAGPAGMTRTQLCKALGTNVTSQMRNDLIVTLKDCGDVTERIVHHKKGRPTTYLIASEYQNEEDRGADDNPPAASEGAVSELPGSYAEDDVLEGGSDEEVQEVSQGSV